MKLYALNAERQWDDKGTGHVTSTYVERLKGMSLLVRAESDGKLAKLTDVSTIPECKFFNQNNLAYCPKSLLKIVTYCVTDF